MGLMTVLLFVMFIVTLNPCFLIATFIFWWFS